MNGYGLSKHEDLVAVVIKAYSVNHLDEVKAVIDRKQQADGSYRVRVDSDAFVRLIDKAVSEYAAKLEGFDKDLARVIKRESGTLFALDAGEAFWNWFEHTFG